MARVYVIYREADPFGWQVRREYKSRKNAERYIKQWLAPDTQWAKADIYRSTDGHRLARIERGQV